VSCKQWLSIVGLHNSVGGTNLSAFFFIIPVFSEDATFFVCLYTPVTLLLELDSAFDDVVFPCFVNAMLDFVALSSLFT
jgi:hypothetical protein